MRNVRSNKYMDVSGAGTANGTSLVQYADHGGDNQKFWVKSVGGGIYEIIPMMDLNMRLDISGASTADYAQVQLYQNNGTLAQRFKIAKAGGNNYYAILTGNTSYTKCITVYYASYDNGATLIQHSYKGASAVASNDHWYFEYIDKPYEVKSFKTEQILTKTKDKEVRISYDVRVRRYFDVKQNVPVAPVWEHYQGYVPAAVINNTIGWSNAITKSYTFYGEVATKVGTEVAAQAGFSESGFTASVSQKVYSEIQVKTGFSLTEASNSTFNFQTVIPVYNVGYYGYYFAADFAFKYTVDVYYSYEIRYWKTGFLGIGAGWKAWEPYGNGQQKLTYSYFEPIKGLNNHQIGGFNFINMYWSTFAQKQAYFNNL